jgi:hypothetical protein
MSEPSFQLWFAVRYLHMASAALLAGGATIVGRAPVLKRQATETQRPELYSYVGSGFSRTYIDDRVRCRSA